MFCKIVRSTLNEDILLCRVTPFGSATPHEKTDTPLMHPDETSFRSPYMAYGFYLRSAEQRSYKTYLGPLGTDKEEWFVSEVKVGPKTNMRKLYKKVASSSNILSYVVDGSVYEPTDPATDYDTDFHPMSHLVGTTLYNVYNSQGFECPINRIGAVVEAYLRDIHSIQRNVSTSDSFKGFINFLYSVPQTLQTFAEYLKTVEPSLILPYVGEGVISLIAKFVKTAKENPQQLKKYLEAYGLKPLEMLSLAALADRSCLKKAYISAQSFYMLYDFAVSSNFFSGEVWPGFAAPGIDKAALQTGMLCSAIELSARIQEAQEAVDNGEYADLETAKKAMGISDVIEDTSGSTEDGLKTKQGTWTVGHMQDALTIYALKALCNEPIPDNRDVVIINCLNTDVYLNKDTVTRRIAPGARLTCSYPCIVFDDNHSVGLVKSDIFKVDEYFFNASDEPVHELRNNTLKEMIINGKVYDAMKIAYVKGECEVQLGDIKAKITVDSDCDITSFAAFAKSGVTKEDCMKLIKEAW